MCGIAGMIVRNREVNPDLFTAMVDEMTHRGPDDRGLFIRGNVALGMRRLSIIDVSGGHQPLFSTDEQVVCVGNGELYDHKTHRQALISLGRSFATHSDIEIAPHMLQVYGEEFVNRIEGMFGLALFDQSNHKVYVYRDRIGIKPIFYYQADNEFIFSSDINVILRSNVVSREPDDVAATNYLNSRFGAGVGRTFFKNIKVLMPGQYLVIDTNSLHVENKDYAQFGTFNRDEPVAIKFDDAVDQLDHLLRASVQKRLMSEVPLGTLLSSGIDSSLLTAVANKLLGAPIDAFTVSYDDPRIDETEGARFTANQLKIKLHACRVSNADYATLLPEAIGKHEGPLSHPNSVPVHMVTQLARNNGYKVLLSGEGADELFAGYGRTHNLARLAGIAAKYPGLFLQFLAATGLKFDAREASIMRALAQRNMIALAVNYFNVSSEAKQFADLEFEKLAHQVRPSHLLNDLLQLEQRTYLQELLLRQDKMSMWSSMEVRVPFVGDPNVVKFANALPFVYKYNGTVNKLILRKVAERYLPSEVCYRPKRGFGSPIGNWLREKNGMGQLADHLAKNGPLPGIEMDLYRSKLNEHRIGRADHEEFIFKQMNLMLWRIRYSGH